MRSHFTSIRIWADPQSKPLPSRTGTLQRRAVHFFFQHREAQKRCRGFTPRSTEIGPFWTKRFLTLRSSFAKVGALLSPVIASGAIIYSETRCLMLYHPH